MIRRRSIAGLVAMASTVVLAATGCTFNGLNSLPLPGTEGRGANAMTYHVELANVGTLESNSPVLISDVVVGSVSGMTVRNWHADVEISVRPEVVVPANAIASVGQTSLLGSMHLALNPPLGQPPTGRLLPDTTIGLNRSSTYPSTEQTLSSLSVVVNGGGLGKIGDIVTEFNAALNGREDQVRELLTRLDDFVGVLARQRDDINLSITALNRLSGTLAGQSEVISDALQRIPPALDVLIKERPRITTALEKFRVFSETSTALINATQADLVRNLENLEPTVRALADVGPILGTVLAYVPTYPYPQNFIDRAIRGDYLNEFITFDFTIPRLKRGLFLGTRWGQEGAPLVPAPGDPFYANYTKDPLNAPIAAPPPEVATMPPLVDPPQTTASPADPAIPPGADPTVMSDPLDAAHSGGGGT
ncbi:MCE family protein [Mycolicibacterium hippocampi]|uniref:Virulence factor Mce n=1 Tax=Mycolicibacterium hippocampi TaxID=659824 RepID=A0A7I9ZSQ4_9MYCO|nr:MCE family protein [Mycolicibacterium hippocampi]GFH04070.1 virulence factor Mce [Mycolicibacterium hippocampi]